MTARGRKGSQSPLVLLAAEAWSRVDLRRARMNIEIGTGSPETNGRAIRENGRHTVPINRNSTIWFDKGYHQRRKLKSRIVRNDAMRKVSLLFLFDYTSEIYSAFISQLLSRKICLLS